MKWVSGLLVVVGALSGCGNGSQGTSKGTSTEITVLAASSLRAPVDKLVAQLEKEQRGLRIRVSYAGSQELIAQIQAGAPADVFLCAGAKHLTTALSSGSLIGVGTPFAMNRLAVAFRPDLDPPLDALDGLGRKGLRVVLAGEDVPVGQETRKFLSALEKDSPGTPAAIWKNVRSFEASDMALVGKVKLGEADAAIVYRSNLGPESGLGKLEIPDHLNSVQIYFAAVLKSSKTPEAAGRFVSALVGDRGREALETEGFVLPPAKANPNEG